MLARSLLLAGEGVLPEGRDEDWGSMARLPRSLGRQYSSFGL